MKQPDSPAYYLMNVSHVFVTHPLSLFIPYITVKLLNKYYSLIPILKINPYTFFILPITFSFEKYSRIFPILYFL